MDKSILYSVQLIIPIAATIITALLAIGSFRKSIKERKLDLLWKQANAAKEFVHEIHLNKPCAAAISMLDWFIIDKYAGLDALKEIEIKYEEVLCAMPKIIDRTFTEREHYILDCFDWFFYYLDRTEQHIVDGFFRFDNVKYIFYPYYIKILQHQTLYEAFMKERYYKLAPDFLNRFKLDIAFQNKMD